MVNTFITSYKENPEGSKTRYAPDYESSANSLDLFRLRKQCVEGYQILRILEHIHHIVFLEGWDKLIKVEKDENLLPAEIQAIRYLKRVDWIKNTRKKYLNLPYRYCIIDGIISKCDKDKLPYRINKSVDRWKKYDEENILIWVKDLDLKKKFMQFSEKIDIFSEKNRFKKRTPFLFPRNKVILPEDNLYTLGFSQHPIVKMWIGYEDSLRQYINAHIKEYCSHKTKKGDKCTMNINISPFENSLDKIIHPWWITQYNGVILSHRASLLRKEKQRKEKEWYWKNPLFTSIPKNYLNNGYIWTGSFDESSSKEIINDIFKGKDIDVSKISFPI